MIAMKHLTHGLLFVVVAIVAVLFAGVLIWQAWNLLLSGALGVRSISYLQALGLTLIAALLLKTSAQPVRGGRRAKGPAASEHSAH